MRAARQVTFGGFRLDSASERLWHGSRPVALRPKAFAVLRHLVAHAGELVTKEQLLEAVWPSTFVTDAVLKDCIRQLREALDDDPGAPRYIETAHRRGYRFIGTIAGDDATPRRRKTDAPSAAGTAFEDTTSQDAAFHGAQSDVPSPRDTPGRDVPSPARDGQATGVLGRDAELARLRGWLTRALGGERQIVFITGEPGIGKTTIVQALLDDAARLPGAWIARGQCVEHFGAGEAYLPVLDALSRLGRGPDGGARLVELLRQHAPAWLLELPSLLRPGEREALRAQVAGATRERMLREMAEAIDAVTADAPLILVLEDLHWSDRSTLDLVAYLARRRDPARLLVIGTYRPVELILGDHPLKNVHRELLAHRLCQELRLACLTEAVVAQYLTARLAGRPFPKRLARLIHRRTEGNPLFMVNVVSYLLEEQILVEYQGGWRARPGWEAIESGVPESLRLLIERHLDRLTPDERRVLGGAAVVGMECSSVAIAAGLDESTTWVEERCEALVRTHQFLSPARLVELPDGTITPRYKFSHVLYLDVPYGLLPPMSRAQIHGRIGACGESLYGDRVDEIAAELAMHFEQARDRTRAVKYLLMAADTATHRSAHHEAAALAERGLRVLGELPETPARVRHELDLRTILAVSLLATKGVSADGLDATIERALALCGHQASPQAFMAWWLFGLTHYHRAELTRAYEIAEQLLDMATGLNAPALAIEGHRALGVTLVELGRFSESLVHLDRVSVLYAEERQHGHVPFAGHDPKVVSDCFAARALWALGYPARAVERVERASTLARELSHAQSLILAIDFAVHIHQLRGDATRAREHANAAIALAEEYGQEMWGAFAYAHRGWTLVQQGAADQGIDELRRGLSTYEATGARIWRGHFLGLLAETLGSVGRIDEALRAVADALAHTQATGEHWPTSELHRLQGELLIVRGDEADAEPAFARALALARQQQAKSLELKAATSLARLYARQGKRAEARALVREIYEWFTEGHETADMQAAKALLG